MKVASQDSNQILVGSAAAVMLTTVLIVKVRLFDVSRSLMAGEQIGCRYL